MKLGLIFVITILNISILSLSFAGQQTQYIPGAQQGGQKSQPGQIHSSNQHSDVLEVQYTEEGITSEDSKTVDVIVVVEEDEEKN